MCPPFCYTALEPKLKTRTRHNLFILSINILCPALGRSHAEARKTITPPSSSSSTHPHSLTLHHHHHLPILLLSHSPLSRLGTRQNILRRHGDDRLVNVQTPREFEGERVRDHVDSGRICIHIRIRIRFV